MLTSLVVALVSWSQRRAALVITFALALTLACGFFAAGHFKINTDINQLLSEDLGWRQQEKAMEKAFPQKVDTLLVVIDGDTAGDADRAAAALADAMSARKDLFSMVARPDALPFFRANGLLFLDKDALKDALARIVQAQPLLGMLTSDPSLRGLFDTFTLMAQGAMAHQIDPALLERPFAAMGTSIDAALAGQDRPLTLQSLAPSDTSLPHEKRRLILSKPILNYNALEPGKAADDAVRALAQSLQLTPNHGVRVRLTGPVPLSDEEFASIANGTGMATALSGILVMMLLLLALRSLRLVAPILFTLAAGLVITTAFALAAVGSLNLISVAFAVMFIGIAVDFGIQFGVRYRGQRHREPDHVKAMKRTAGLIALPLGMAAGSTALGFFAFIPTAYRGISELGLIAGAGMLIAFVLNITLLPALLTFAQPPAEPDEVGWKALAPVDRFMTKHRRQILVGAAVLAFGGFAIALHLRFDFDPLNLKDPHTELVSTLLDLAQDPDFGVYSADILRPSLPEAEELAAKLAPLPESGRVMTLASFVPADQNAKMALIGDTRTLLAPTLSLPRKPAPRDAEIYASLGKLTAMLKMLSGNEAAQKLAAALDRVAERHDPALLQKLQHDLVDALRTELDGIRFMLNPRHVTEKDIPPDLRRDWVTEDGRYLVQAYPKGNPRDTDTLAAFTAAIRKVAPDAGGSPVSIYESGRTITKAFFDAGIYALIAIVLLALAILRRPGDVARMITPLILAGILTLATIVAIGLPLNFANIIALPLLLSLGVSYAIYFVSSWRAGVENPLQTSMARAVVFSAATVLVAFSSLALSSHPGTAGMGELLTIALVYSLGSTFFVLPALLGPCKKVRD